MASLKTAERIRKRETQEREALERGSRSMPNGNDMVALLAFEARGIPAQQVDTFGPNQNVYTYAAWRAKGRQVRKGEKSVKLTVWRPFGEKPDPETGKIKPERMLPVSACVFHVSQTDQRETVGAA